MITVTLLALSVLSQRRNVELTFCCRPDNDLYKVLSGASLHVARFDSVEQGIRHARSGSSVLILTGENLTQAAEEFAAKHTLRLYIERGPGRAGQPNVLDTQWNRVVVTTSRFGPELMEGRILSIGRQFVPITSHPHSLLVLSRVAGFDKLAFGLPPQTSALLWEENPHRLVAATKLSEFAKARFAPAKAWKPVIGGILAWLGAPDVVSELRWSPAVRPSYGQADYLPANVEGQAAQRGAAWFLHSHLLMSAQDVPIYAGADRWPDRVGPAPLGNGDGMLGALEGYSSAIDSNGGQAMRWYRRSDCNAESAMALAQSNNPKFQSVARNLGDFVTSKSEAVHSDPTKASFGLAGWNDQPGNRGTFYGDDNARYILGLIGAAGALKTNRWDDSILRCILGNFRTSGVFGFRGDALQEGDIERLGWPHYFHAKTVNKAPHFEAYLWACNLWAYQRTHYRPLLERSERAIEIVLNAGENAWTWTNGLQQERARMLLPLSWLVRVDDTPEHRRWLVDMVRKVLSYQAKCGAIREEFGDLSHGIAGPPRSNDAFGTAEAPLIQENGDPLADMLYTTNFAFLGLHEAVAVTHDPAMTRAENQMADFLCRIQVRSESHPEFDGAWFRAFDFGDWDYWASNSDLGWGAWSIESGWSVAWITTVLSLRQHRTSLWDVHAGFRVKPGLVETMLREPGS